jgi:hypothetical protein
MKPASMKPRSSKLARRTCPIDRKSFQPVTSRQKFCSLECQNKDKRNRYRNSDYNARFESAADYALVQKAAAKVEESMNAFIIRAAVERARVA